MISHCVDVFVKQQRALGFKYRVQSILLRNFATFAHVRGDEYIVADTVLEWSREAPSTAQKRNRLLTVRRLAMSVHADDPLHEIPPADAFGSSVSRRRKPHIYSEVELDTLRRAALCITPVGSVRPLTFHTLITLLWVSGLRISEALALDVNDITVDGLLVRATKFRKNRLVPVHSTTRCALDDYLLSNERTSISKDNAVFVSLVGTRLSYRAAYGGFLEIMRSTGLRGGPGIPGPCLHDLRHSFAVRSLERCPACAQTVQKHMVALSTYLGHAHITDTYWYLEATPALTKQIAKVTEAWHSEVQS